MTIDSDEDLEGLVRAGRVVASARNAMVAAAVPGVSTGELDAIGRDIFKRFGARSAPRLTYNFPGSTCVSVNNEAAHGVPSHTRTLHDGNPSISTSPLNLTATGRTPVRALRSAMRRCKRIDSLTRRDVLRVRPWTPPEPGINSVISGEQLNVEHVGADFA